MGPYISRANYYLALICIQYHNYGWLETHKTLVSLPSQLTNCAGEVCMPSWNGFSSQIQSVISRWPDGSILVHHSQAARFESHRLEPCC